MNSEEILKIKKRIGNIEKVIDKSMNVLEGYSEQIALHLVVEKEQLKTQKLMQVTLNEIRKKL